jgi:putative peptidoglycan lipid II flippase
VLVAGLYRAGECGAADVEIGWWILIADSVGLWASTTTRVYHSGFFALRVTATPARAASGRVRVALVTGAGVRVQFEPVTVLGLTVPAGVLAGYDASGVPLGPLGLAAGASIGAWVEWAWLRRALDARVGRVGAGAGALARMFAAALAAGAVAYFTNRSLGGSQPLLAAGVAAAVFGAVYFAVAAAFGLEQASALPAALLRRVRGR